MNGWHERAERQYGVITRAQLRAEELSNRQIDTLLANGTVERLRAGVYRVAGSYPSKRQKLMAAALWCGNDALLSDETAGALMRLPVLTVDRPRLLVGPGTRRRTEDLLLRRSRDIEPRDRFQIDGLPCTSPTRTVIDLAATMQGEDLEYLFERARRLGLVTKTVLAHRFEAFGGRGHAGSTAIRELLAAVDSRPKESKLEVRTARLLRDNGIVPDVTQHRVGSFRLDFAWLRGLRAVECDGFDWQGNRLAWKRDRRRIAALEARGWQICHVTWDDVTKHQAETLHRLRLFLAG